MAVMKGRRRLFRISSAPDENHNQDEHEHGREQHGVSQR